MLALLDLMLIRKVISLNLLSIGAFYLKNRVPNIKNPGLYIYI